MPPPWLYAYPFSLFGLDRFTKVTIKSNYPKDASYTVEGAFEKGKTYKCTYKGDLGETSNTVVAQSSDTLDCGTGPGKQISKDFKDGVGKCTLVVRRLQLSSPHRIGLLFFFQRP